jgi:hypothetical protein
MRFFRPRKPSAGHDGGKRGYRRAGTPNRSRFRPLLELLEDRLTPSVLIVDQTHPDAADSNPGSADQPLRTISEAATRAVAGDTVLVSAGDYAEMVTVKNTGTSSAPIVLQAAAGATVFVHGGKSGAD